MSKSKHKKGDLLNIDIELSDLPFRVLFTPISHLTGGFIFHLLYHKVQTRSTLCRHVKRVVICFKRILGMAMRRKNDVPYSSSRSLLSIRMMTCTCSIDDSVKTVLISVTVKGPNGELYRQALIGGIQ